jgi:hypothetical protein
MSEKSDMQVEEGKAEDKTDPVLHLRFPAPWPVVAGSNKESPPSLGSYGAATREDARWRRGRDLNPRCPCEHA